MGDGGFRFDLVRIFVSKMQGGIAGYAERLIRWKARQLLRSPFFRENDFEDLQQDLLLAWYQAWPSFDERKGDPRSFTKTVINNAARSLVIAAQAEMRWTGSMPLSLDAPLQSGDSGDLTLGDTLQSEENIPEGLSSDLGRVISSLPPDLALIAEMLKTKTLAEIARETGIPRTTLNYKLKKLAEILKNAGLDDYL